jgi:tRNA1Val (adenine37-N6)-methyltransferase
MIDVDEQLCELARENARANGWSDRIEVACGDARATARAHAGGADLVVCNPPYVPEGRGRPPLRATRRSKQGPTTTFLDAARALLGRRARACFVYPALETTTFFVDLRARGLEPKRVRAVHAAHAAPARVLLVECVAGKPGGLRVEPPLFETDAKGRSLSELFS